MAMSFVGGARFDRCGVSLHARCESTGQYPQAMCGQFFPSETMTSRQRFQKQVQHSARESHHSTDGCLQQFVTAAYPGRQRYA